MVTSISGQSGSAVSQVLKQQQQQVAKQRDEQRIDEQRNERIRELQEDKQSREVNNKLNDSKGSFIDELV